MLNEYNFKSIFKNELNYFIKFKRSQGWKYEQEIYRLKKIDNILFKLKLNKKEIDKTIFENLVERNFQKEANYARQYSVTVDFCKYLIFCNYSNIYYVEKRFKIINNYIPTILTKSEINRLFDSLDRITIENINDENYKIYYTYSVTIRLIYACGLRFSEVTKINIEDINFDEKVIYINDSKRHVSRLIVYSESMGYCLKEYINKFEVKNGLLFRDNHNPISGGKIRRHFKKALKKAGLNVNIHLHDLRHIFCNYAFNQMLEKGFDENTVIIYLYKYMGHKTITETEYYLHFTNYNMKKIIKLNKNFSRFLYEGVDYNE